MSTQRSRHGQRREQPQAKALVQKAAEYLKREGKEKALPVFSDPNGEFVDGDLYLFVMDAVDGKLTMLAHGVNKALTGKPQIDVRDANDKAFNQETIAALSTANEFWLTYAWPNPITKKNRPKEKLLNESWRCNHRGRRLQLI
jgi:cytochrome c